MGWNSFHIFYYSELDHLLLEGVAPLVRSLEDANLISQMFFLRYWKDGPHLRLRLFVPDAQHQAEVIDRVNQQIGAYLSRYPSDNELAAPLYNDLQAQFSVWQQEEVTEIKLAPNNSFLIQPYEPEYAKYGGKRGVAIAEQLFDSSAHAVLMQLPHSRTESQKISIAFTMMLPAILRFGFRVDQLPELLDKNCRYWSRDYYSDVSKLGEKVVRTQLERLTEQVLKVITGDYTLLPAVATWQQGISAAADALQMHREEVFQGMTMVGTNSSHARKHQSLLMNYLHTHNNRLGLNPFSEALVSYLGERVTSYLLKEKPELVVQER